MSGPEAIAATVAVSGAAPTRDAVPGLLPTGAPDPASSFADMIAAGLRSVEAKVETADGLVRQFAVDETVPVHQVTIALEEARIAVELAVQIRARLVESYREIMNMQL